MRAFSRRAIGTCAVAALLLAGPLAAEAGAAAPSPARDATVDLALPVFGYPGGATVTGTSPRFDLYVPDYRSARRMTVRFVVQLPEHVDGSATVIVRVDGTQVGSATVDAIRKGAAVGGTFEKFRGSGRMIDVSVESYLTVKSSHRCSEYDPRSLWLRVSPESSLSIVHATAAPASVAEFFQDYDGRFAVTVAPGSPDAARLAAVGLGYWLNQIERWRRAHLTFESKPDKPSRTIVVVAEAAHDVEVRDGTLYATPNGIALIAAKGAGTILAPSTGGVAVRRGPPPQSPVSLDALGVGTRTQRGSGDLTFPIDFTLGTFGGLPQNLHLHLAIAHGPYQSGDRATVSVLLNGAAVNGFSLAQNGKTESYDVPLDANRLVGSNHVAVIVEFVPKNEACAGGRPALAVSLLGSSTFSWRSLADFAPTVGEFFNEASDTVGVGVGANLDAAAFALLDRLGAIDPNVGAFDFHRYAGGELNGVKDAIYVADPRALAALPIAYDPATARLDVADDAGRSVYQATLDVPAGILQSIRAGVPSLVLTYAKSPSALDAWRVVSSRELAGARYDVLVFNDRGIAYTNPPQLVADRRRPPSPVRRSWPLFVLFVAIAAIALALIANRARRVS
jgi:hypothetical protein